MEYGKKFGMEWKIFSTEWMWNGRNFAVWNMEKPCFIPFLSMPCYTPLPRIFLTKSTKMMQKLALFLLLWCHAAWLNLLSQATRRRKRKKKAHPRYSSYSRMQTVNKPARG